MAKKGFLAYGEKDEKEEKDGESKSSRSSGGPSSASEMKKMELLEKFLEGGFGGEKTQIERRRGQLEAFGELLRCYGVKSE